MSPRDPLTLKLARTARETARDPYDWFEGPAEPHYVIGVGGAMNVPNRRTKPLKTTLRMRLARWWRAHVIDWKTPRPAP